MLWPVCHGVSHGVCPSHWGTWREFSLLFLRTLSRQTAGPREVPNGDGNISLAKGPQLHWFLLKPDKETTEDQQRRQMQVISTSSFMHAFRLLWQPFYLRLYCARSWYLQKCIGFFFYFSIPKYWDHVNSTGHLTETAYASTWLSQFQNRIIISSKPHDYSQTEKQRIMFFPSWRQWSWSRKKCTWRFGSSLCIIQFENNLC